MSFLITGRALIKFEKKNTIKMKNIQSIESELEHIQPYRLDETCTGILLVIPTHGLLPIS